ncbi:MAG TPA: cell wall-binding repeat-containing protein [Desulfitobacteriaceae bacterium]|nr:cell wall-binding repeat-containing protein [Desulfitobacteriaceae bacterium]
MRKKKFSVIALGLILLLILSGCSKPQQEILNAYLKMQDMNNVQRHLTLTFEMSGTGFDPYTQQDVDQIAMYMNNTKIDVDEKTNCNNQNTVCKSLVETNLAIQGLSVNIPTWKDIDLSGDPPKFREIIKLPLIISASLPKKFSSKEYMTMNPLDFIDKQPIVDFVQYGKVFREKEADFLTGYSKRFNPAIDVVYKGTQAVQSNDSEIKAKIYEVKLNDAQFKEFISYTVNNFVQDQEAISFVKDFLSSIIDLSQIPDKEKVKNDLPQKLNEDELKKFLDQFNQIANQFKDTPILGDDGLVLQYAITGDRLVKTSGSINLKLDIARIAQTSGTLNLKINFVMDVSELNKDSAVQIPEVNDSNSFDYADLLYYTSSPVRLSGQNRYQTARVISEYYSEGTVQNVIVTTGNNYSDALSATVLARKLNAPILLFDTQAAGSQETINYISQHLDKSGTIHILGGPKVIGSEFETKMGQLGFNNIERISGNDRYDTNVQIAQLLGVAKNTPVIIASGEDFPDVLSISSFAGNNGYPILFVAKENIPQQVQDFISNTQPAKVYIIGGTGVISKTNESRIHDLAPDCTITRLAGQDRYETAGEILNTFSVNPTTIYIASGNNFPDALAGSVLASAKGDPIILVDPNSPRLSPAIQEYLIKLYVAKVSPEIIVLGGYTAVPYEKVYQVESILKGYDTWY